MKKPTDNPCWKQFWWYYIRSYPGSGYQDNWGLTWAFYLAGRKDQANIDEKAMRSRPELVPNQN